MHVMLLDDFRGDLADAGRVVTGVDEWCHVEKTQCTCASVSWCGSGILGHAALDKPHLHQG